MTGHVAYAGVTVDHLYRKCPALQRSIDNARRVWFPVGAELRYPVDPEGTDICGWCHRTWKGRQ